MMRRGTTTNEPSYRLVDVRKSKDRFNWKKCGSILTKRFPIFKWLREYKKSYLPFDLMAGCTVWLTAIPASLGDATVAGLSPEFGLYASYIGAFIYVFLGSCRELAIGPQAALSLVTFQTCGNQNPECVILLGFYSGAIYFVLGLLHLGFLVSFISEPVTVGFTAAAALLIASGQLVPLLGMEGHAKGTNLIQIWTHFFQDVKTVRFYDSIVGLACTTILITMFKLKDIRKFIGRSKELNILSICRNALVLIGGLLLGYCFYKENLEDMPFKITGEVRKGFPPLHLPHFQLTEPRFVERNGTDADHHRMSIGETLKFFGSAPFVIAIIGVLHNVMIAKQFADGATQVDATQELIALGVINLVGAGMFDALPCCASFSRSGVNATSGAKSHLSGLFTGVLMVLSLAFLTPYFKYIPKATLASIILAAVLFMVDFHAIARLWKFSKLDLLCCMLTFLAASLLGMEYGILIGVAVSILIILLKSLRPCIRTEYRHDIPSNLNYIFMRMDQGISFPSVDYIQEQVLKKSGKELKHFPFSVLVLECSMWTKWDYTSVNAVVSLVDAIRKNDKILIFYGLPRDWLDFFSMYGLENPVICWNLDELSTLFIELTNYFIGPQREILAGMNAPSAPQYFPRGSLRESHSNNYNFVRRKYTIKLED